MGKLKVVKASPLSTIQDFGRYGYRRYGIPQSGAMDKESMIFANQLVGNKADYPVVEFAITGMRLEAIEDSVISTVGAGLKLNGKVMNRITNLKPGDIVDVGTPDAVYGYLAIRGLIEAKEDFGSVSTYVMAGFGGMEGRVLQAEDILISRKSIIKIVESTPSNGETQSTEIRIMKGPEWNMLKELPSLKSFEIDPSSNRMGVRLKGILDCEYQEISSSAVIPGTIQLPANGQPIILMNDCQTTGGYPRIGKVLDEDLGKLAQMKSGRRITFRTIS